MAGGRSDRVSLTKHENRLWKAIQDGPDQIATVPELDAKFASLKSEDRVSAINGLLSKNLVIAQHAEDGTVQFRAQSVEEARLVGRLDDDEQIVFGLIRDGKTEGMWTKVLRNRSGLHSSVVTRVLKSLESQNIVKTVKSVKFPTRKIYMLSTLEPSVELSGGPWYTDNELDTEFIKALLDVCESFIQKHTWPSNSGHLYPAGHIRKLPTAAQILAYIRDQAITSTALSVGDLQALLDVLVWDGKVEKVPVVGGGMLGGYDVTEDSDSDVIVAEDSDEEDDNSSKKKTKRKRGSKEMSKKSKRRKEQDSDDDSGSEDIEVQSLDMSDDLASSDENNSKSKKKKRNEKSKRKSSGPTSFGDIALAKSTVSTVVTDSADSSGSAASSISYRALRPIDTVRTGFTQVPCGHCPVFDFCSEDGPVNPRSCEYMRAWINNEQAMALKKDEEFEDGDEE